MNSVEREKTSKVMREISAAYDRIKGERELINEALADLSAETGQPKPRLRKLAKHYHKMDFAQESAEFDELETLFREVTGQ